jgi:tetratricopeptide (TPR) repeat protein
VFPDDSVGGFYWVILSGACLGAVAVSSAKHYLQRTFVRFGGVPASNSLTGAAAAKQLLVAVGLKPVAVVRSNWVDCYDPRKRQVQLRDHAFDGSTLAALAIAAHEVGHAEQFARGYWPARLRLWTRSIYYGLLLAMLGVLALGFFFLPIHWAGPVVLATGFVMLVVQIPTVLPLEYDASRRAKALAVKEKLLAPYEESSFDRLLTAASRTYLAWECQRWLVLLAGGAAIVWFTPAWSADPGEFANVPEVVAAAPPDGKSAVPDPQSDLSIDLTYPLLSSFAMVIPAALFVFAAGKYAKTSGRRPTTIETAVTRNNAGLDLFRRGDLDAAVEAFDSALALNPQLHAAYVNRGQCHLQRGELDRAMADVEESLRLNPHCVDALAMRGHVRMLRAEYDLAIADMQRALDMAPRSSAALTSRGNLYLARGAHDLAMADFEQAIRYAPEDGSAYLGRASIALARGNLDAALADCSQALAFGVNAGSAYGMRGLLWIQKRDYDRAIADLTAAQKSGRDSAVQLSNRGLAYYLKGSHDLAIADLDKAIELDPKEPVAYNNRGAAYLKLGNFAAASADLHKAIDLKPEFPNPHKHLAWLKATCPVPDFRDGVAAVAHVQRAHHLAKESPAEYQALLAAAYAEAGDFTRAVECQTRCVDLSPPEVVPPMRERLTLYESHQPFRDVS